jgi:hypothetical protein
MNTLIEAIEKTLSKNRKISFEKSTVNLIKIEIGTNEPTVNYFKSGHVDTLDDYFAIKYIELLNEKLDKYEPET